MNAADNLILKISLGICAALFIGCFVMLGLVIYQDIDSQSLTEGIIIEKIYSEAYETTIYIQSGAVEVPVTTRYPETYSITIEGNDPKGVHKKRNLSLSPEQWKKIKEGQYFKVAD